MIWKIITKLLGANVDIEKIKKSVQLIINSGIKYEFRTTIYPKYIGKENVEKIAKYLQQMGCKEYILQDYYNFDGKVESYSMNILEEMKEICNHYLPTKLKSIV